MILLILLVILGGGGAYYWFVHRKSCEPHQEFDEDLGECVNVSVSVFIFHIIVLVLQIHQTHHQTLELNARNHLISYR